jgi:hypothetical protein
VPILRNSSGRYLLLTRRTKCWKFVFLELHT